MTVSAVVVSHGHAVELERSLAALAPQVDEIVVVSNFPGSVAAVPSGVRVMENPRPLRSPPTSMRASPPRSARTSSSRTRMRSPLPAPSVSWPRSWTLTLAAASPARSSCGPTGRGSRRAGGSRPSRERSCGARRCASSTLRTSGSGRTTCSTSARPSPSQADWMLGAFLLQRRTMLEELGGWDAGYRHYVEDIDLCYRAMRAGWERWYVPAAVVHHAYAAVIDRQFLSRHTLWHLRGMARFVRKHPEALRHAARALADPTAAAVVARSRSRPGRRAHGGRSVRVDLARRDGRVDGDLDAPRKRWCRRHDRPGLAGMDHTPRLTCDAPDCGWPVADDDWSDLDGDRLRIGLAAQAWRERSIRACRAPPARRTASSSQSPPSSRRLHARPRRPKAKRSVER